MNEDGMRKLANNIVLELRGKFGSQGSDFYGNPVSDVEYNKLVIFSLIKFLNRGQTND